MSPELPPGLRLRELLGVWARTSLSLAERNERLVVCRTLPETLATDAIARDLAGVRSHPGLAPTLDVPEVVSHGGRPVALVSDLVPGEPLSARLRRGPVPTADALEILATAAEALADLPEDASLHGVLHPAHLWTRPNGELRVLGLGLSRLVRGRHLEDLPPATLAYLAPEQLHGESPGPESDAWTLGLLLHESMSGRRLFDGSTTRQVADSIASLPIPPLQVPRSGVEDEITGFLPRLLERQVSRRLVDLRKIAEDLRWLQELLGPSTEALETKPRVASAPRPPTADPSIEIERGRKIGPYEIVGELGQGGMGSVYRARDLRLERDAALKFLPRDVYTRTEERRRFVGEAKAASALDHPNICTIYGIDETPEGQIYIAMACYDGSSLAEILRDGPLSVDEALDVAEQIASALSAAHRHGIVHRDVKPGNIVMTQDGVAKLVDFGLASSDAVARSGEKRKLFGTIPYLAPEQALGGESDHRADLWALGVLLYEALAGFRPFAGQNMKTLWAIVHEQPMPIEQAREDIPPALAALVSRSLSKDPDARYGSADELLSDLRALRHPPRKKTWLGAAVLVGLALLLANLLSTRRSPEAPPVPDVEIAFLGLLAESETEQLPEWSVDGLSELFRLELSDREGLRILDAPERLRAEFASAGLEERRELAERIADRVNVRGVASGSVASSQGEGVLVRASLLVPGEPNRATEELAGTFGALPDLAQELASAAAALLDLGRTVPTEAPSDPEPTPQVTELLQQARTALRHRDAPNAVADSERAVALAPSSAWPRVLLAEALDQRGDLPAALESASRAAQLSAGLPKAERVFVRALVLEIEREHLRAAALYRVLWEMDPVLRLESRQDLGVRLAVAETKTGRAESALTRLATLAPEDPRVSLARAEALHWLGRFEENLSEVEAGIEQARSGGLAHLVARGLRQKASALWRLGNIEGGHRALDEAEALYVSLDSLVGQADCALIRGILHYETRDLFRARESYERAAHLYASLPNPRAEARTLSNKALVLEQQGELDATIEVGKRAVELYRETDDELAELITLVNLSGPLLSRGRMEEAREVLIRALELVDVHGRFEAWARLRYADLQILTGDLRAASHSIERALEIQTRTSDDLGRAETLRRRASIHHLRGAPRDALDALSRSLETLEERGRPDQVAVALRQRADILITAGELEQAESHLDRAQVLADEHRLRLQRPRLLLTRSRLRLATGRLDEARTLAEGAAAEAEVRQDLFDLARAYDLSAQVAARQDDLERARFHSARALALIGAWEAPPEVAPLRLRDYRLRIAAGDSVDRGELQQLLADLTEASLVELELETRLVLALLDRRSGAEARARARLEDLLEEARFRELRFFAREIELLLALDPA